MDCFSNNKKIVIKTGKVQFKQSPDLIIHKTNLSLTLNIIYLRNSNSISLIDFDFYFDKKYDHLNPYFISKNIDL